MRYLSIIFEIKDLDRTNAVSDEVAADMAVATEEAGNESQIANFRFPHGNRAVFNGEFDSGSERTLAAWIRHASRTRLFVVAIRWKV